MSSAILRALYLCAGGTSWKDKTGWLGDAPPCGVPSAPSSTWKNTYSYDQRPHGSVKGAWFGVVCDEEGSIVSISLYGNGLSGTIPTNLGLLTKMTGQLQLGGNVLSGTIPTEFGKLTAMTHDLALFANSLSGTIPPALGKLTAMTGALALATNALSGTIPTALAKLTKLAVLTLTNNSLVYPITSDGEATFAQATRTTS